MLIDGAVNENGNRIGVIEAEQMSDVQGKGGVRFAKMLAGDMAVDPGLCGMIDGLELNAGCGMLPAGRSAKIAPIPGQAAIINEVRIDLPGMGDSNGAPVGCGSFGGKPTGRFANGIRVRAEKPIAVERV